MDTSAAHLDVLVIGAGQAGLAVAHHLARRDLRFHRHRQDLAQSSCARDLDATPIGQYG
jgi:2-polyprenyl-6-methoxyphenol hydroxylase-like FAD-dependent oxidoreductase